MSAANLQGWEAYFRLLLVLSTLCFILAGLVTSSPISIWDITSLLLRLHSYHLPDCLAVDLRVIGGLAIFRDRLCAWEWRARATARGNAPESPRRPEWRSLDGEKMASLRTKRSLCCGTSSLHEFRIESRQSHHRHGRARGYCRYANFLTSGCVASH